MSRITQDEVARVAALARLHLSEADAADMARQLDAILDYVEQLSALDTDGVEPTSHVIPLPTPMREDVPEPGMQPHLAVANAPQREGSAFVVPLVIEGEE